ncbi:phosphocarrier protein HPr /phosphoenolpyruvate--protein phosphotransferase /PTS system IIA component (Glc family) [Kushneria sinocarnis]|uniref:phosphoenolpyruvate--protein phosphotransferase n=1 Tax=Kushneria sinocarnis TaxID=595502 RepID=A0A420WUH0_9GAMM|nr:phosphoenolpyruvate--protein phosphotransferase [Kushneria sinocarnis]RKQ97072.1 phosphocarrier protein HPr /phosphoenolpyruvate--protein phosphotransferase /PTS system IIA component (Glc family) [Kushneria sinocarnis]
MTESVATEASFTLMAPCRGVMVPLAQVPDPVFAGGSLGPGVAIEPLEDVLHAPCEGEVVRVARTRHAVTLRCDQGPDILLHLGLDTVALDGEGIEVLVAEGERVSAGQPLCRFDVELLAQRALSLITPIIVTEADGWQITPLAESRLEAGAAMLRLARVNREVQAPANAPDDDGGPLLEAELELALADGLHARPAARLREIATTRACRITLRHDEATADVRSLTELMGLGLSGGDRLTVAIDGAQREAAMADIRGLLEQPEAAHEAPRGEGRQQPAEHASAGRELAPGELAGLVASPGLACGPLRRLGVTLPEVERDAADSAVEHAALQRARDALHQQLETDIATARSAQRSGEADIFAAHLAWLEDPDLFRRSQALIEEGRTAVFAWRETLESEIERLVASRNRVIAARASDLRDLQRRLLLKLLGREDDPLALPRGAMAVADEITPSQFIALCQTEPAGLCLAGGGVTSHVAILARARGLPCLAAMGEPLTEQAARYEGAAVILDADRGRLELTPDDARLTEVHEAIEAQHRARREAQAMAGEAAVTRDVVSLEVAANVADTTEAERARELGADGIGLLRSEFLFMARDSAPSLEEQREVYQAAVDAMADRPVIIRTLDIGADKALSYLPLAPVANPALGVRGVRLIDAYGALLDEQLRALLAVEAPERLRIMVPMVTDVTDLQAVRQRLQALADEAGINRLPQLGAMIEVPAAALCADALAEQADFLSIGTNDLTQYALAMDREEASLAGRADVLHPAVLRLIAMTVEAARRRRCWVGVCGAAAGDPLAWAALAALGVDELSVEPMRVADIKAALRKLDLAALAKELPGWLMLDDGAAVRRALGEWLANNNEAGESRS